MKKILQIDLAIVVTSFLFVGCMSTSKVAVLSTLPDNAAHLLQDSTVDFEKW